MARLAPGAKHHFRPKASELGLSAERLERYRGARTAVNCFDLHPGPERLAKADLTNDLKKQLCETPCLRPRDFRKVELDHAGRAREVLARGRVLDVLAAAVGAVTAATARHTPTETELLSIFAAHEELEGEPAQEWIAGPAAARRAGSRGNKSPNKIGHKIRQPFIFFFSDISGHRICWPTFLIICTMVKINGDDSSSGDFHGRF